MTEADFKYCREVGARILAYRKKKKVTLKMIADAGITTQWNMVRIQKGHKSLHLVTLKRIADLIGVDIKKIV